MRNLNIKLWILFFVIGFLSFSNFSLAQTLIPDSTIINTKNDFDTNFTVAKEIAKINDNNLKGDFLSKDEFKLSILIIIFGLTIILLTVLGLKIKTIQLKSSQYLRLVSIVLIITSILILVTAGYDEKVLSPVLGLLGTVAGYLLGKSDSDEEKEEKEKVKEKVKENKKSTVSKNKSKKTTEKIGTNIKKMEDKKDENIDTKN